MSRLDGSITVFSPDGQLLQVVYAQEAVNKGSTVVGVRGPNVVVLAVEKRMVPQLQTDRTEKKIVELDEHIMGSFAGLRADARVIVSRSQIECQAHRLTIDESCSVEYITRYVSELMQYHTQSNGRRPFGVAFLIAGFHENRPRLYQTDPSGVFYEWKATAIGRSSRFALDYLEANYKEERLRSVRSVQKLALAALLHVLHIGQRNLQVAMIPRGGRVTMLDQYEINDIANEVQIEKEREDRGKIHKKSSVI